MGERTEVALDSILEGWERLSETERLRIFHELPRSVADDFFLELSTRSQMELLISMPRNERRIWIRLLPPDDAADILQLAPEDEKMELLDLLDPVARREVNALLAYHEDVAGGLMNPRFARARADMTVDEAITYLRRQAEFVETVYYAYVLDDRQRLLGVVSFRDLFAAERNKLVRDVMKTDYIAVPDGTDQENLARLFGTHHLLAVPVVDDQGRMKGIVTVDDIVDVVQEEASEDMQKIGGMAALDAPYLKIGFWSMAKKRGGWLALLFLGEMLTATAMGRYEEEIERAVVLALFIPLIISSGGNTGSQATTLVIRAMAVGEVRLGDWFRVVRREFFSGLVLGIMLAMIGMLRIVLGEVLANSYGEHYMLIGLTVSFSLLGVVLFGTLAGSMLPFLLRRVGLDPASASAPFVATLVDVTGVIIYFSLAAVLLHGTLL